MPLTLLTIEGCAADLSPLEGMKLTEIRLSPQSNTKGMNVLRKMQTLKTIGLNADRQFPPAEFWKKYDAGEFGKPQ
jgi:hypothetical protein